ncbi:hypothetical protein pb186bvf_020903 [Paramecium bursaria]
MYLIFLFTFIYGNFIKQLGDLYEDYREQISSEILGLQDKFTEIYLNLPQERIQNKQEYHTKRQNHSRILQTGATNNTVEVNEYYRQGPLRPIDCTYGKSILINVTRHYCFKTLVTQTQYYDLIATNRTQCEIRYRFAYGCLCPADFYGGTQILKLLDNCRFWNKVVCDIQQTRTTCNTDKKYGYVQKYDGDPPCELANQMDQKTMIAKSICYNQYNEILNITSWSNEENYTVIWSNYTQGIDGLQIRKYRFDLYDPNNTLNYLTFSQMPAAQQQQMYKYTPMKYYYESDVLKSSISFNITPWYTLIDWTSLSKSQTYSANYNLTQVEMNSLATYQVTIQPGLLKSLFGRYNSELYLINSIYTLNPIYYYSEQDENDYWILISSSYDYIASNQPKVVFFEDPSFVDAYNPKSLSTSTIIFIVLIFLIILGLIGTFVYYKKIRKANPDNNVQVHQEENEVE